MTVRQMVWLAVAECFSRALCDSLCCLHKIACDGLNAAVEEYLCTCEADTAFVSSLRCWQSERASSGRTHSSSAAPPPATPPAPAETPATATPPAPTQSRR